MPWPWRLDRADCVPDIVSRTAGANKGLRVSDGTCTPRSPDPTGPAPEPTGPTPEPTEPGGTNLSVGAGSDGSGKAGGTS
ncbi:hypothetical protein JOF35_008162 [Streptomyces demainii]|uniref:Uncharacterized protein n=1 Tax=Streptomyces demainii TaxID=588122 RepID=A0ABT9L535_9ACTN|nr:hypothetical protein [Streptomyces demainii]